MRMRNRVPTCGQAVQRAQPACHKRRRQRGSAPAPAHTASARLHSSAKPPAGLATGRWSLIVQHHIDNGQRSTVGRCCCAACGVRQFVLQGPTHRLMSTAPSTRQTVANCGRTWQADFPGIARQSCRIAQHVHAISTCTAPGSSSHTISHIGAATARCPRALPPLCQHLACALKIQYSHETQSILTI